MAIKRIAKFNVDGIKIKEKSLPEYLLEDNKCLDDRYLNSSGGILKGDIELDQGSTYSIGSEDKKLKALYADEVHISQNTLYINETPVLGTESDTITIKADVDQSVLMKTSGIGVSQITSEKAIDVTVKGDNGNISVTTNGANSSINLSATKNINITGESVSIDGNTTIKNLNVTGTTTTVNSTDLSVKDNIIEINAGETGNGVSKGTAGIKVNRGDELPYLIEFDEAEDMFKVGMQGDLETIASQNYVNDIANNKSDKTHTHDDRYYTESEIDSKLSTISSSITSNINILLYLIESKPTYYTRPVLFTTSKTSITIPANMNINIGGKGYVVTENTTLNVDSFVSATDRVGKDLYVYACQTSSGYIPTFVISLNSTVPSGYTADNSRKIGGFHCLCANVGTISGHPLSGYVAGNIIPNSQWDLLHRAVSNNEGMVYIPNEAKWVGIYLSSYDGSKLVSVYGGTVADGESSKKFHGELFVEELGLVGCRLPSRDEFMVYAKGSNEQTVISGAKDWVITGGHVDTAGRRMISNYGVEDCCGFMWQWTNETYENYPGSTWNSSNYYLDGYAWQAKPVYQPDIDSAQFGSCNGLLRRSFVGGRWNLGSYCGSRCVGCHHFSATRYSSIGGRAVSELRVPIL